MPPGEIMSNDLVVPSIEVARFSVAMRGAAQKELACYRELHYTCAVSSQLETTFGLDCFPPFAWPLHSAAFNSA